MQCHRFSFCGHWYSPPPPYSNSKGGRCLSDVGREETSHRSTRCSGQIHLTRVGSDVPRVQEAKKDDPGEARKRESESLAKQRAKEEARFARLREEQRKESERLAKLKIEAEQRLAKAKSLDTDLEGKLREAVREAVRLAKQQKEEAARLAKLRDEQRKEADRLTKLKAESEERAKQKAAAERQAKEKAERQAFSGIKFGDYHALVIGIDDYRNLPKLKTAVNDAKAVGDVLKNDYGLRCDAADRPEPQRHHRCLR